jgi:hypothetical protein
MAKSEKKDEHLIRVLSLRPGDVVIPDGRTITCGKTFLVDEETATWLEASFKGYIQRVD